MANPNKSVGTRWETTVENFLNECDLRAKRTGSEDADKGDIHAGDWTFEAKDEKVIDLPGHLRQLAAAVLRAGRYPFQSAVWVKNRRHSVGDAYVVMSGQNYRALMVYTESLEVLIADVMGELGITLRPDDPAVQQVRGMIHG